METALRPHELRVSKNRRTLTVMFEDGERFEFAAEMLRVLSPSAEVQGHSPRQRQILGGKQNVEIIKITPVGNYAVRITFDDLHDSGIYSWKYFYTLGSEKEQRWSEYLTELQAAGLHRTP